MDVEEKMALQRVMDTQIRNKGDWVKIHKDFDQAAINFIRDKGADQLADALELSKVVQHFEYGDG